MYSGACSYELRGPSIANSDPEDQDDRFRVNPLSLLRFLVRTTMHLTLLINIYRRKNSTES